MYEWKLVVDTEKLKTIGIAYALVPVYQSI